MQYEMDIENITLHHESYMLMFDLSAENYQDVVIDDSIFQWQFSRTFFSRHRIVSKQRDCHIRQTICSTRSVVRVCLLVVWCKNF